MKSIQKLVMFSAFAASGIAHAQAQPVQQSLLDDFSGPYLGLKVGANVSSASGETYKPTHTTVFPGFVAGYGFNVGPVVLGAEVFMDLHHGSATYKDGGIDAKIGYPIGQVMPYGRIGFTTDWPATALHGGLGVEYKLTKNVSMFSEWTHDSAHADGSKWTNDSFTIGVNYRFK
jgi:outer membrane immunogenic protein